MHIFIFTKDGFCVLMKDGTKLGNVDMVGTIEADGFTETEGTADGATDGVLVGGGRPSGDIVRGGKLGASVGRFVGALLVGTALGATVSFLIGAVEGMSVTTCIGAGVVGGGDMTGVATGDDVIGAVVVTGANVKKSSAKHVV